MMTIALAKGRLSDDFVRYLKTKEQTAWYELLAQVDRELVVESEEVRFLLVKGADVLRYVEEGIAEIGILGSDILLEHEANVYNVMDLPFGQCHFALASIEEKPIYRVVASKYVNYTKRYFDSQMQEVKIIPLSGSVELAATIGMADAIIDIVQSGETLRINHLTERIILDSVNARLVVNKHAYFTKYDAIQTVIEELKVSE